MASTDKIYPPENKITPAGWTMPEDVAGEMPAPPTEESADCVALIDRCWFDSADRWVGTRFAMLQDGGWSTGQDDLFGGGTRPDGSWPKQMILTKDGEVFDVRPWIPRPTDGSVQIPTPTTAPEAPNMGSNIKNGPKSLGEAARINWGMNPATIPTEQEGHANPANAVGNLPTPKAGSNRNSRKAIMGGHPNHPSKSDLSLEQAVECLEGTLPREVADPSELPSRFQALFPTPTSSERAGINPNTGKGGVLSRLVKDEAGIEPVKRNGGTDATQMSPTPRAGKTSAEDESVWRKRQEAGGVSTPPLGLAVKLSVAPTGPIGWAGRKDGRANWPTPRSSEYKGVGPIGSKSHQHMLEKRYLCAEVQEAELGASIYPTPRGGGGGGIGMCGGAGARQRLSELEEEGVITEEERRSMASGGGGQLNPDWVEPLMGYRCDTTRLVPDVEAWLKVDAKRLKVADLKKIHDMDEAVALEEEEPLEIEPAEAPKPKRKPKA